ncbi:hypothetical protein BDQ94DRAFT_140275 [Aspergillus welwitschiae]|uniref:Uncharacterized protein n=1 Tax=Aspergillus welwitschiae TaxID=1341132 RepID=A0A3F3Q7G0_9EURO|nr:hypothetical protein BDQ94DRAFT_140275 [Aspergillus welwitschiae]RDH35131.1 hypothetical protein BDQ94DRAFT_140275 [Aspergillus welwitschiae]
MGCWKARSINCRVSSVTPVLCILQTRFPPLQPRHQAHDAPRQSPFNQSISVPRNRPTPAQSQTIPMMFLPATAREVPLLAFRISDV